ncbi:Hypp1047 [Branchiostoma lanceolatum]|uniref:Hypp1047 protein n=1 Tax=Branchiostoma lanceolatum TaxID=7740 RepID=A0A8K0EH47_BRALA|nr:Hypp1047 [Branchiostoma lanceolatum]
MGIETGVESDNYTSPSRKTPSASQGSILKREPSSKTVRTRGSSTPKKSVSFDPTPEVFFVPSRCESRTDNAGARVSPQSPTDVSTYLLHYQGSNYERTKSLKWDSSGHNVTQPPGASVPTGIHAELYSVAASLSNLVPRRRLRDLLVNTEDLQVKMKKFQEDTDAPTTEEEGKDATGPGGTRKTEPAKTLPSAKPTLREVNEISLPHEYGIGTGIGTRTRTRNGIIIITIIITITEIKTKTDTETRIKKESGKRQGRDCTVQLVAGILDRKRRNQRRIDHPLVRLLQHRLHGHQITEDRRVAVLMSPLHRRNLLNLNLWKRQDPHPTTARASSLELPWRNS